MKLFPTVLLIVACLCYVSSFQYARLQSITQLKLKSPSRVQHVSHLKNTEQTLLKSHSPAISSAMDTQEIVDLKSNVLKQLKIGSLFGIWYALNIGYNIYNKKVLNAVPQLTYTVALLQLILGLFYVFPVWMLKVRKAPVLNAQEVMNLTPVAVLHSLTHLGAVVSLGAGAVSFTHIVKAAEPAISAGLSALILNSFLPLPVYLSLIPVMGGVALASLTELSFSWTSFIGAMVSNFASAGRGIAGKMSMGKPQGQNMNAANLYAVMTILASVICLPICMAIEGSSIGPTVKSLLASGQFNTVAIQTLLSAMFYYLYNEVAFLALDNVAPVTHALGNTIKRVVIIVTSVIVFGNKMSTQGAVGSSIAILGVLLYSMAKNYFK